MSGRWVVRGGVQVFVGEFPEPTKTELRPYRPVALCKIPTCERQALVTVINGKTSVSATCGPEHAIEHRKTVQRASDVRRREPAERREARKSAHRRLARTDQQEAC